MLEYYKESGLTPLQFINNVKQDYPGQKICYTARLDPMARGVIPILIGDECKKMDLYTNLSKTYEVKVIIGVSTDTDDALGLITNNLLESNGNTSTLSLSLSSSILSNYKSIFEIEKGITLIKQKYHYFSTKALLSRSKNKYEDHYHNVELYHSKVIDNGKIDFKLWVDECINIIDKVDKTKEFRQKEIIEQWKLLKTKNIYTINYITLQLHVGSGFFVRQYIHDLSVKLNIPLMCYDINRISVDY